MNKIQLSEDGSHTIFSEIFNATYHSTHGSVQEAKTVFIDAGLSLYKNINEINILEMGFGSGLNMLMSLQYALKNDLNINYHTIELHPISKDEVEQLNFTSILKCEDLQCFLNETHSSANQQTLNFKSEKNIKFSFTKHIIDIHNFESNIKFDIIYYDAFGPLVQPSLWEEEIMSKMYNKLLPGGVLVTYCAKGSFKRALKNVGFLVEALPGPIGKREMTRAFKPK
jgi:tRNA U34 5-methylaminomethyl-2-thiouridine-forming methyltransferase MnmC